MTTLETLVKARMRITPRDAWIMRWFARDSTNKDCKSTAPEACKWCSAGAINSLASSDEIRDECHAHLKKFMGGNIAEFNDRHTHAEVLTAFDEAIARLESAA